MTDEAIDDVVEGTDVIVHGEDDLAERSREELAESTRKWYGIAVDTKNVRDQIAADLETALNACRQYQRMMAKIEMPDPNFVTVRQLLTKYKMDYTPAAKTARVFVDGVDITEHPDSIDSDADVLELTSEEYYGVETVELVQTEDGQFHIIPKGRVAPDVDTFADEEEPTEPVSEESREWLQGWESEGGALPNE